MRLVKFRGIAFRWFTNVFLIVVAVVVTVAVLLSAFISSSYIERVRSLGNDYAYDFSVLKQTNADNFKEVAVSVSQAFAYKDKIEVQVFDKDGNLFLSTTGVLPEKNVAPDYEQALKSNENTSVYNGKNAGGEKIYAVTTAVYDKSGEYVGAYRWITSLKATNRQIALNIILICLLSLVIFAIYTISGHFFVKSIVNPIREVSNMSRKIAMGEFDGHIRIDSNDEIGELCDAINSMAGELNQAEKMKNDFISSVSHELRTPLTAIKGWGETAKMSLGTDEELVGRGLDVVLSEAERLSSLVEELLDFSRMQSGRLTVNVRPINIVDVVSVAADMYTELAKKQGLEISFTKPENEIKVLGDTDRLKQVFINIIDNAVKYTEKGGLVLITTEQEEGCVKIVVKDTGVGIPAQDIDHVKEKFFKSNKTVRGSGIGLAVADEIMKQHNGLIFLESTEGVGTTVTVVFPLYEEPEQQQPVSTEEVILTKEDEIPETQEIKEETEKNPVEIFETDGE
ncbi:MAG TPA: sensor histidine kinase [Ruminococcaceae bacterium]|nr:sensor histidine kinase [Oscillospiraceae bacterium]